MTKSLILQQEDNTRQRLQNELGCNDECVQYVGNVRYPGAVGERPGEGAQIYDCSTSEEDVNKTGESTRSTMRIEDRAGFNAQVLGMRDKDVDCSACGREGRWCEQQEGWRELSNDGVRLPPAA